MSTGNFFINIYIYPLQGYGDSEYDKYIDLKNKESTRESNFLVNSDIKKESNKIIIIEAIKHFKSIDNKSIENDKLRWIIKKIFRANAKDMPVDFVLQMLEATKEGKSEVEVSDSSKMVNNWIVSEFLEANNKVLDKGDLLKVLNYFDDTEKSKFESDYLSSMPTNRKYFVKGWIEAKNPIIENNTAGFVFTVGFFGLLMLGGGAILAMGGITFPPLLIAGIVISAIGATLLAGSGSLWGITYAAKDSVAKEILEKIQPEIQEKKEVETPVPTSGVSGPKDRGLINKLGHKLFGV